MRVGLVLGAGGSVGAAWLIGALDALESETGWRSCEAERIVGTSAGSAVGALIAQGYPPALMAAYAGGEALDDVDDAEHRALLAKERIETNAFHLQRALPPIGPGSWRLALSTLRAPHRHNASAVLAGWLPRGFVSTAPIRRLIEQFVPAGWPEHDGYWAVAADYATGRRVAFGHDDARRPTSPRPSRRRVASPASTTRSRSAAAATSTAGSAPRRTSTSCAARASTSSCASTRCPRPSAC
jgi:NTE family protein